MTVELELTIHNGEKYIYFWDNIHGNDVGCKVNPDGTVKENDSGESMTLNQWLDKVAESAEKQSPY